MTTIQLEVSEEIVRKYGIESLVQRLQQQLEVERLKILAEEIQGAVQTAKLSNELLLEEARVKAWEAYKQKYLSHILS